jgi:large subunit ribosomal protein MRP49
MVRPSTPAKHGARKFWKDCLPRLKFWNPAIPMLINRHTNQAGPATMSIYFRQSGAASGKPQNPVPLARQPHSSTKNETPAPAPEEGERVVTIDMKNQHSDAILAEFLQKTGATVVQPTAEDRTEMVQIEELKERGAVDRVIMKRYLDDKRREERMLARAKEEAEAIKAANQ